MILSQVMAEQEATDRCAELSRSDPERTTHSWVPREGENGDWSIVKLAVPSPGSKETIASTAEDEQAIKSDPRTSLSQNVGQPYG